ncbi:PhzF family phenazine biosynthesis protein [Lewinella aquimaris]|uniref:PhzF family phenazine biosynthesis protein n=1 Tax=Neolewinella aquimaris TaxID=1835722 RepID=A0A840DXC2_9BACT|nr:PhzF family phenazine biosynthesis protein [Neolewinella aquimaris]MBB4077580.1 PhzF family phenazine biosynthesis protein [Neolewinella aquimaris]
MHNLPLYQVDAFTGTLFGGNPAAVVPVPDFPSDALMQDIATENNLSETAFVAIRGKGRFDIRWFTPTTEVRLCGHATLAAAHVLYHSGGKDLKKLRFTTREAGTLVVTPQATPGTYVLALPVDKPKKTRASKKIRGALAGIKPVEVLEGQDDLLVVLKNERQLRKLRPNFHVIEGLKKRGLIVTAPGDEVDFVSRCFYPAYGITEDPVTGSAHTLLTPFWAKRLNKKTLTARQLSKRGGELTCELRGKKVRLEGQAITYLAGQILLDRL